MDVGSDPQINNMNTCQNNASNKFMTTPEPDRLIVKKEINMSKSQPSLWYKDLKSTSLEGKNQSLDKKDNKSLRFADKDIMKKKLIRSRSSGAKYSRFRDKYKQSNLNKAVSFNNSDTNLKDKLVKHPNQSGSVDTGSDFDDTPLSDWASEEAACDEEVRQLHV